MTATTQPWTGPERRPGTNTGHGHVWPRPDGKRSRCGGPSLCAQCQRDVATWQPLTIYADPPIPPREDA